MTDMHISKERFHEIVIEGLPLSESEFSHLSNCAHCVTFSQIWRARSSKSVSKTEILHYLETKADTAGEVHGATRQK